MSYSQTFLVLSILREVVLPAPEGLIGPPISLLQPGVLNSTDAQQSRRFIKAKESDVTDAHPWTLATFCVETPEGAVATAKRLKHDHARMERHRPDGSKLTWSVAGMERLLERGRAPKPFFITWDDPSVRPDKVVMKRSSF